MFDEGHYEPARKWSQLIRQFQAPRILFTATPYRNDLKVFDINLDHVYSYTYQEAVQDNYLREVEIVNRPIIQVPEPFIEDVLRFYDDHIGGDLINSARVIIRCENRAEIRQIATILGQHQRSYLAIHESFSDNDERIFERKSVPDPNEEDATFWIHQFKLLEGIDDSRFQLLAIYEPFRSSRPLIQQIGRVIRNPQQETDAKGYVLDHSGGLHNELWEGFLEYDAAIGDQEELRLAIGHSWLSNLLQSQPGATYIGGRFRSKLDLDSLVPDSEILIPQRVNLLQKLDIFDLDDFCNKITEDFEEKDRIYRRYNVDEETVVFVYVDFQHSRFLESATFIEPKLSITVIHEIGNLIAFFDSQGYVPINEDNMGIGKAVHPEDLKKLFQNHPDGYLTHVSLRNTNLSTRSIRSRAISAAIMHETVSAFDDHAQVCTTATGYSIDDPEHPDRERRYVGFNRGRVSQSASKWLPLNEYLDWIQRLVNVLRSSDNPQFTFHRYAPEQVEIEDTTPVHILLDLFEVEDKYATLESDEIEGDQILIIPDKACEIEDGNFTLLANGVDCSVQISYNSDKKKYELSSAELDSLYRNTDPNNNKGLIDYLNREQSFRIITRAENVVYVLGEFYRPIIKVGIDFNPDEFEVSKILIPCEDLGEVGEEKQPVLEDGAGWHNSSLFGIIDDLGRCLGLNSYFGNPDILVCDDMGTEIADFILADSTTNMVIFIHAKASDDRRPFSASVLQDVCSQVTKNINYLGMFNKETPPGLDSWDQPWRSRGTVVNNRKRIGDMESSDLWNRIRTIIKHPLAEREVWLFLGQILSKRQFEENLARQFPTPEALQGALLLHATMTNVASVGAKLRVFCYT